MNNNNYYYYSLFLILFLVEIPFGSYYKVFYLSVNASLNNDSIILNFNNNSSVNKSSAIVNYIGFILYYIILTSYFYCSLDFTDFIDEPYTRLQVSYTNIQGDKSSRRLNIILL